MTGEVRNNEAESRYELEVEGELALAAYRLSHDRIVFTHTEVPTALEGKGIGSKLVAAALDDDAAAGDHFARLSYSNKRRHVLSIEDAKTAETRQRRIAKAIETLRVG